MRPDERRNQGYAGIGGSNSLVQSKEQGKVAVNAFLLQHFGRTNAFPCRSNLDQDALATHTYLVVLINDGVSLLDCGLGVVGQPRVYLGGNTPRNNGQDLLAKSDGQMLEGQVGHVFVRRAFAKLLARFLQHSIHDGLILRHLRGGSDQGRICRGILGAKLLHRLNVAGVGHDHSVVAQLFQKIRHHSSLGKGRTRGAFRHQCIANRWMRAKRYGCR